MPHDIRPDVLIVPDDILTGIAHREILNFDEHKFTPEITLVGID